MKIEKVANARQGSGEPPRSTAYYYGDLERLKRQNITPTGEKNGDQDGDTAPPNEDAHPNPDELSEYVESNEVVNDGAVREVPPLRDRRQWSLPEYTTPENPQKVREETYSTAGTFPMPEPKEKEPLLAELEIVGRVPLTQLDSTSGVRRSRSWYLCCPNVGEEEVSRESSWRYSSLRPVTAPPVPGQNGIILPVTISASSGRDVVGGGARDSLCAVAAERDLLARALAAERARAASAARAHDARLAELHGVIAELMRRRKADNHAPTIPEEELSEECESTTQAAGELDNDADHSRTDQNDTSSILSPELPTPQQSKVELRSLSEDGTDTSARDIGSGASGDVRATSPLPEDGAALALSERDSELCLTTARWCRSARARSAGSCERDHGSADEVPPFHQQHHTANRSREPARAKLASRVRLKRAGDNAAPTSPLGTRPHQAWCAEAAERLALQVCAQAGLREALVAATNDDRCVCTCASSTLCGARCARLAADCRVLECALARAADTARRLAAAGARHESRLVAVCCALRAADAALELYDVLLALAETQHPLADPQQRAAAELVGRRVLARLDAGPAPSVGEPLLSPGPWLHHHQACGSGLYGEEPWSAAHEARLREHAARLKAETVALRDLQDQPRLFSYHDEDEDESAAVPGGSVAEMEAAVCLQEALSAREAQLLREHAHAQRDRKGAGAGSGRRHWLDAPASETDL